MVTYGVCLFPEFSWIFVMFCGGSWRFIVFQLINFVNHLWCKVMFCGVTMVVFSKNLTSKVIIYCEPFS